MDTAKSLGLRYLELYPGQKLGPDGDVGVRPHGGGDLPGPPLVPIVDVGVDEVDHERFGSGRPQRPEVCLVVAELHLPDADPVEAGRRVGADVVFEGRIDGGDLAQRERHDRPGTFARTRRTSGGLVSCFATR